MNTIKEKKDTGKPKAKKKNFFFRFVRPIIDGSFISRENTKRNFAFLFYIIILLVLFISNTFRAQDTQRKINKTKEDVKIIRIKSIYQKSQLMESTRPTKLARMVKPLGLRKPNVPPQKIIVKK